MTAVAESLPAPAPAEPAQHAPGELAAGRMVVLFDGTAGEGLLLLAAAAATKHTVASMIRHTSGLLRAAMTGAALDRLRIPPMLPTHQEHRCSTDAVSVDARRGVTTGISAADRARTFRVLADPASRSDDLVRPGHVIPERAADYAATRRCGRVEAAVTLVERAGLPPVGVLGELVDDAGEVLPWPASCTFARTHGLAVVSVPGRPDHPKRS